MHIFMKRGWNVSAILLLISLYATVIIPMTPSTFSNHLPIESKKKITIFDPINELVRDKSCRKVVPRSIMITPDGQGCIIARYGEVSYSLFSEQNGIPKVLIEHPCAKKYIPMIAMAQKKNKSLMIVSAGNYRNIDNKRVAEYILFSQNCSRIEKLDWPIQTIALNDSGTKLAIAGLDSIIVVDLKENQTSEVFARGFFTDKLWFKDVAMYKTGGSIVGVGSRNEIQYISVMKKDGKIDVSTLTQAKSGDDIQRIYYPSLAELLYITSDGRAKTIDMYDLLEPNNGTLKATDFSHPSLYDMVAVDPSEHIATAHWTKNVQNGNKIKVYRKNHTLIETFILEVPTITERYEYITEYGRREQGVGHLLDVAIRGNCVVALVTDGKMWIWSLPEIRLVYNSTDNGEKLEAQLLELSSIASSTTDTTISPHSGKSSRSTSPDGGNKSSEKHFKPGIVTFDSDDLRGRKSSTLSRIKIFTSSRESSPSPLRKSASDSPHRPSLDNDSDVEKSPKTVHTKKSGKKPLHDGEEI